MKRWDLVATVIASAALPIACTPTPTEGPAQQSCFYDGEKREAGSSCECDNGASGVVACPVPDEGTEPECRCSPVDTPDGATDAATDAGDTANADTGDPDPGDTSTADTSPPVDTGPGDTGPGDTNPGDTGRPDIDVGPPVQPGADDLLITEYMADPEAVSDDKGEWFEIYNPSNASLYQLDSCTIGESLGESHEIDGSLTIGPGEYITLGRSDSPGFGSAPDYVYGNDIQLENSGPDEIQIECNSTLVDHVNLGGLGDDAPTTGAARGLDPTKLSPSESDNRSNWCDQTSDQGNGDKGTPGAENDPCS